MAWTKAMSAKKMQANNHGRIIKRYRVVLGLGLTHRGPNLCMNMLGQPKLFIICKLSNGRRSVPLLVSTHTPRRTLAVAATDAIRDRHIKVIHLRRNQTNNPFGIASPLSLLRARTDTPNNFWGNIHSQSTSRTIGRPFRVSGAPRRRELDSVHIQK